ncbi:MAG: winged helix-turn-helix domain-containing protein [Lysobacter sp.]
MLTYAASSSPQQLRVGQCTVDIPSREVHAPGARRPRRITPKSMGVLLALVAHADRVVSRDALLASVWPDTQPSDDVVTQAVTQLRKAFGEVRDNPRYIETIAKGGYRLLAEVEWLDVSPARVEAHADSQHGQQDVGHPDSGLHQTTAATGIGDAAPATGPDHASPATMTTLDRPSAVRGGWKSLVGVVGAVLLLVAVLLWWVRQAPQTPATTVSTDVPTAPESYQLEPHLITSAPGFELSPTLSPDAAMVAYMAIPDGQRNIAIMVQTTTPTPARQLTHPAGMADDARPRWSPDGREIAFMRVVPGQECHLLVIPANGGPERTAGSCHPDVQPEFDWTPDGRGLIYDGADPAGGQPGLHVLDLASGRVHSIEYRTNPDDIDTAPRYSPDGRWIVFVRNSPLGDFWRIPASGGSAERLTRMNAEIRGWDWTPNGKALVYARRSDSTSRLYRHELGTGVHDELGVEDGEQPVMARNVRALAYVLRRTRFGIYRFDLGHNAPGERLFASSGRDRLPAIAPDGRQLVFTSDRSGPFALWWADVDNPVSLRVLEGIPPESRHLPAWSADSSRVLVVAATTASGADDQGGVYEVTPASGRVTRLPLPVSDPLQAVYLSSPTGSSTPSPDERLLVLADGGDGRPRLSVFDRSGQPRTALATLDDVAQVQVDARRQRILLVRAGQPGLWQIDFGLTPDSLKPVELATPLNPWHQAWAVARDGGILYARRTPGCPALLSHQPMPGSTGTSTSVKSEPRCLDLDRRAATTAFSFDPRAERIYITLAEYDGGDIGFASFDLLPETAWPDDGK